MYLQEATLEANQERMDFQRARITEVNQYLKMVMESSDRVRIWIYFLNFLFIKILCFKAKHLRSNKIIWNIKAVS